LEEIEFIGWDISNEDVLSRGIKSGVIPREMLDHVDERLLKLLPMAAPVRPHDAASLVEESSNIVTTTAEEAVELFSVQLKKAKEHHVDVVAINLCSTEADNKEAQTIFSTEDLMDCIANNDDRISGGMAFAVACIESGVPYIDFTPDSTLFVPAIVSLADARGVPVAGKDGNTGQTFLKLCLADFFERRHLPITSWYSTNVLGNLDGRVLSMPGHYETKIRDKTAALQSHANRNVHHNVDICYDETRGDWKEAWDSVKMLSFFGHEINLRLNWEASDSALAVPVVFDLLRLIALSAKRGDVGIQKQLSVFFKAPIGVKNRSIWEEFKKLEEHYGV